MSDDHERFADLAGAYVLGALAGGELAEYGHHLETCDGCRAEVERLKVAADALPASPPQLSPPPELKARIMAVVQAEAELLQAAGARADEPAGEPPPRRCRAAVLRRGWWSVRPGLAIAATVLVLAIGIGGGLLLGGGPDTRTVVASVAPQGSRVELLQRDGGGHSTLVAKRLPDPGSGRVYQVWLKSGKAAPVPTDALFGVRRDGSASVDVPGSLKGVDAVLVTSEPAGGSPAPTRQPILSFTPA